MADKMKAENADSLAWLVDSEKDPNSAPLTVDTQRKEEGARSDTDLIKDSFSALALQEERLATQFCERLVNNYPDTESVFEGISFRSQKKNMLASLGLLVEYLEKPTILKDYLYSLVVRHIQHGGTADHYSMFAENLLAVMADLAGESWEEEIEQAWKNTLHEVVKIMLAAYASMIGRETEGKR